MSALIEEARRIASTYDVDTLKDQAVVYSISYMPDCRNKEQALAYIKNNPQAKMLDNTPCGKALINMGLDGKVDEVGMEITNIWRIASSRFIKSAMGNIHAFVKDADERSTFCSTELSEIMNNNKITHINGIKKELFKENFKTRHYNKD